ncbi:serine/threonine protein phosphatase PrpC [Tamaricihabitans halophyticus]|uniref:Serine/threonine protein phosphatase PrpC n=1 Tax=Tamaricihabitans halophyticus TaxID=1262583 RepID=A0A4R2RBF3_9PSEU|nr:serine/threonine protein phosphatase PrpC [Tamaricihabitans halophyticus]
MYSSEGLVAVADGIGGHVYGEVASGAAIAAFVAAFYHREPAVPLADRLADAVRDAGRRLDELVANDPRMRGMGTTLTACAFDGANCWFAHLGDSRAYLLRDGELRQLTSDHTMIQLLIDEGRVTPEQAAEHPRRSMLTRALQGAASAEPDVFAFPASQGDRFLLCSDGLTDVLADAELGAVLRDRVGRDRVDRAEVVAELVRLANAGGGPDNITCVLADVCQVPEPSELSGAMPAGED